MSKTDLLKKIVKNILLVLGILFFLFGVVGAILELSSEKAETMGLVLVVFFVVLGLSFIFFGLRKPKKRISASLSDIPDEPIIKEDIKEESSLMSEVKHEKLEKKHPTKKISEFILPSWQRKFLIISAGIEVLFIVIITGVAIFFGIEGFKAGEMGAIIGVLMVFAVIFYSAVISVRIAALWGLIKYRRWAAWLNFALMILLSLIFLLSFFPIIIYTGFSGWCSYYVAKN